jgi:transposase
MAHARRKIHDLHVRGATVTTMEALRRIGELYAIEAQIRGQPPDCRKRIPQQQSRPLLDDFEGWLRTRLLALSTQSDTTKAINYLLNQWQALVYYCEDGIVEIDNNIAENALRGVALGRKNFMFLGAGSGGERAAAMYSLIVSAKLNGIDPLAYLRHVLTHIADYPVNRIADLLPWNIADMVQRQTTEPSALLAIGVPMSMTVLAPRLRQNGLWGWLKSLPTTALFNFDASTCRTRNTQIQ